MIVTCGQCDTQFRLDDSKVGPKGLRVRCSLCKHAFFVVPASPAVSREQRVEKLVCEALETGPRAPEPSDDLAAEVPDPEEETAPDLRLRGGAAGVSGGLEDDGDWKFNEESPSEDETQPIGLASEPAPGEEPGRARARAAGHAGPASPGAPASLEASGGPEDLGSPESWNLLGAGSGPAPAAAAPPLAREGPAAALAPAPSQPASLELGASLREAARALGAADAAARSQRLSRAAVAFGWVLASALFGAGLAGGLLRGTSPPPRTGVQEIAGLEARVERARFVENAVAGPIYVVSGELRNPGAGTARPGDRLGLRLLDARGRDLPLPAAPLGPPLTERELREWDPARLAREQAAGAQLLAQVPLRPGQRWLFDAVVIGVPAEAAGFRFELARGSGAPGSATPEPRERGATARESSRP